MMTEKDLELQNALLAKYDYVKARAVRSADHASFDVPAEKLVEFATALRDQEGFSAVQDCEALDWGVDAGTRFSVIWHLCNHTTHMYVRICCDAQNNEKPAVPSLCGVWSGCNWIEREQYDLMGVDFIGHPDMRRIMMWDEYPYHPLRKDFPLAGVDVPYYDEDTLAQTNLKVQPAPQNGGPFVATAGTTKRTTEPCGLDQEWTEGHRKN